MENFVTMITPFSKDGSVDFATAEKYTEWYYNNGVTGIFAVCQSSEIFYLSLDERIQLNRTVFRKAKELESIGGRPFAVVSSGHVSDSITDQARELNEIYDSGTDALILITNRLDINNEGDDTFIANAEKLLSLLPTEAKLGFYECPYPYKRLLTPKILDWCLKTGRFYYMKDTCCDIMTIRERCEQLKGSNFKLLNANCQTLLESMKCGAGGYCGIMNNFHPYLYSRLCADYKSENAALLQSFIGTFGFTEAGLPYSLTAKYNMNLCDIPTEIIARSRDGSEMTEYAKHCVRLMKQASDHIEALLKSI